DLQLLEPLGLLGLHAPVLVPPAAVGRLADLQLLEHVGDFFAGVQHRVRVTKLRHDLFRRMPFTLLRHRESSRRFYRLRTLTPRGSVQGVQASDTGDSAPAATAPTK